MALLAKLLPLPGAALAVLALSACVYSPGGGRNDAIAAARATADGPTAADRRMPAIAERDRVLYDYRFAASALRAGDYDEARLRLDDAIARIGGIITNDAEAARAQSVLG
jgi:hypothetical protein